MATGVPLRPDYSLARSREDRSFWRGITASVFGTVSKENPEKFAARHWRDDVAAKLVARNVTSPATTTGWASELTGTAVATSPIALAPESFAAKLSGHPQSPSMTFENANQIMCSNVDTPPSAAWRGEGAPRTIVQPVLAMTKFGPPRTIDFATVVSAEVANYAADTAMTTIRLAMTRAANLTVDSAVLDSNAGDSTRPAGLTNGVTPISPTAGGGATAMLADLAACVGAMSDAGISGESAMFCMNDRQALVARGLLTGPKFSSYSIVGTPALSAGTVVAVAPALIANYFAALQIETATDGLVHMEDTSPRDIDTQAVSETVVGLSEEEIADVMADEPEVKTRTVEPQPVVQKQIEGEPDDNDILSMIIDAVGTATDVVAEQFRALEDRVNERFAKLEMENGELRARIVMLEAIARGTVSTLSPRDKVNAA